MCGIFGIVPSASASVTNVRKFLANAAIAGAVRGDHGTGLMLLPSSGRATIVKSSDSGDAFLWRKDVQEALDTSNIGKMWGFVGHNRAATSGDISDETAHPFQHGAVTLVHNGNVPSPLSLPGITKWSKDRVDSDGLCESLWLSPYEEVLKKMYGAYALAWHDARDGKLRIVRNSQRPLAFMRTHDGSVMFASEADMLWWLAGRANFSRTEVRELATHTLVTIDKDFHVEVGPAPQPAYSYGRYGTQWGPPFRGGSDHFADRYKDRHNKRNQSTNLEKLGVSIGEELEFIVERVDKHHGKMMAVCGTATSHLRPQKYVDCIMFLHDSPDLVPGLVMQVTVAGQYRKKRNKDATVVVVPQRKKEATPLMLPGPRGEYITLAEWREKVKGGCVRCAQPIDQSSATRVVWCINETAPLCEHCVADDAARQHSAR